MVDETVEEETNLALCLSSKYDDLIVPAHLRNMNCYMLTGTASLQ